MPILEAKNLTKRFGGFTAVDNISFSLKEGEILGFLGPNGAGKTTTIQMLLGVLTPSRGEILYFGRNLKNYRSEILEKVSFSSTYTNLPWDLTVKECLSFVSYFYQLLERKKRIEKIIEIFRLKDITSQRMSELSAGQTTRVNLAKAFLNSPKVLLLDEPTASLDPDVADYIREFILSERRKFKVSIVFTSHNMAEVEELCDRVLFIDQGKIVADDTPENLARSIEICHVELRPQNLESLKVFCKKRNLAFKEQGKYMVVDMEEKGIPEFLTDLAGEKIVYSEISIKKPGLEDYFLLTSRKEESKYAV